MDRTRIERVSDLHLRLCLRSQEATSIEEYERVQAMKDRAGWLYCVLVCPEPIKLP